MSKEGSKEETVRDTGELIREWEEQQAMLSFVAHCKDFDVFCE